MTQSVILSIPLPRLEPSWFGTPHGIQGEEKNLWFVSLSVDRPGLCLATSSLLATTHKLLSLD
jgi:hypothetical protein